MGAELTPSELELFRKGFAANPTYRLVQNAVTQTSIDDLALDREIVCRTDRSVSHLLDDWTVTNQMRSGRCWLFAGLNLLRVGAMRRMNLKSFEFSQNYLLFWDKLERANYFLEAIIDTADRDLDDRTVAYLLKEVANDGGQWNMFAALVKKHGLVPKTVMPETQSSSATARMNEVLRRILRQGARDVRALREAGPEAMRARKREILEVVHRVLCIHLGTPPERFDWQWVDKDRAFHRDGELTPQEFAERYVTIPLDDYVCLVHDPRESSPVGRTFTVDRLGNVVGAPPVIYLNVEIDLMKRLAMRTIMDGEPVWFGCDVGKMMRRDIGIWDAKLYDLEPLYDTTFDLTKAERLLYGESAMTHAMLFTGVDVVDDTPRRWRVENSWGDKDADQGFYTMNDSWFDEYVFEIAVRRDLLPAELRAALDEEPIVLPAWDPMGALAH
ncbi:aminopeptidase C [Thermasporomyces composti]|jgi:bleomycin hydrolase|uniref:Aminopeptidase n=1 Tax=Thermasporomyces composti TaxID=696763 RepID=A0A3D9V2W9_THECX|nr:C1 family peptidase [Thermasporomyces composti]REF36152.1 bleomycin hydrolase [Thermasporomyces composti]